ncbi:MAG: hypothetical protein IPH31_24125 [Lewinellaceae bacterium]|nr:hypothetical protein [Lewinellaceae bacterium]
MSITASTSILVSGLYILTEVTLTNTTTDPINNIYYMRNVDPDHGTATPGEGLATTNNSIVFQNPEMCDRALASATTLNNMHYLGLGAQDSRARVTHGGFSNRSAFDIWHGIGLNTSGMVTADQAISVAFNLGNLAPNESATFSYVYILNEADLNEALSSTNIFFEAEGTEYGSGETIEVCEDSPTPIDIINGSSYTWTWSPPTGLNTTDGPSVIATINAPITYTVNGVGPCGDVELTISLDPVGSDPIGNAGVITGPSYINPGEMGVNYSIAPVSGATDYEWVLPPGSVVTSGDGTVSITFDASNSTWCGNIMVTPSNACNVGGSSSKPVCKGVSLVLSNIPTPICIFDVISIDYSASGIYNLGNIFSVELSDENGDFTSSIVIGTLASTDPMGSILCAIPGGLTPGAGYRMRLTSSDFPSVGPPNDFDILISDGSIICPADIVVNNDVDLCGAVVLYDFLSCQTIVNQAIRYLNRDCLQVATSK